MLEAIDHIARRYGRLPSEIADMPPWAVSLDLAAMGAGIRADFARATKCGAIPAILVG